MFVFSISRDLRCSKTCLSWSFPCDCLGSDHFVDVFCLLVALFCALLSQGLILLERLTARTAIQKRTLWPVSLCLLTHPLFSLFESLFSLFSTLDCSFLPRPLKVGSAPFYYAAHFFFFFFFFGPFFFLLCFASTDYYYLLSYFSL